MSSSVGRIGRHISRWGSGGVWRVRRTGAGEWWRGGGRGGGGGAGGGGGYHDNPTGDGFGHIIHNWAAVGRPLIGHARYYAGQRASIFWRDGVTCLDLDRHDYAEAVRIIRETTPERHREMCRAIRATLDDIYDPGRDAGLVAGLL